MRRKRSAPSARKTSTSAEISSKCRTSSRGSHSYSASGMQYSQRKLHRSVTDNLRLRSGRPSVSAIMSFDYDRWRRGLERDPGTKGREVIWPENEGSKRPGTGVVQAGQQPLAVMR